jgi:outer membrane protein OmpA-like peptidoglycan-associated protein/HEPN domain-containing protein
MVHPLRTSITVLLLTLLGPVWAATAQNIESEVGMFAERIEDARSQNIHLIAPSAFEDATERLRRAREQLNQGDRIASIREQVQRGQRRLNEAFRLQDIGNVILEDAIAARSDALEARAPEFAEDTWEDAEDAMRNAGRDIERGNQNGARNDAQRAVDRYREAELIAIRADVLGTARDLRDRAEEANAENRAPETWQNAESMLQEAEQVLEGDRYDRSSSRQLAREAAEAYRHARRIAELSDEVDNEFRPRFEQALLRYEGQISRIAEALGTDVTYGSGVGPAVDRIVAAINSLEEDRNNLQASLEERRRRIDRLQQVIDSLDARLATLEEREQSMSAELQRQRERERTLRQVRDIFSANEAEVLLRGSELIMRLRGLNFPVGSSEIRPENFSLLTKVQRVIREFPEGEITVAGHTDAQGNDDANQKLSEQRAEAVREYLIANMNDLIPARIEAVGFGESQPIATNETEEGRAKNRRIDVTIDLPQPDGGEGSDGSNE